MFAGALFRTRILWSVTTTVQRTNERVADFNALTPNPLDISEFYGVAYFHIAVTAKTNLPLLGVRIYGAASGTLFPAAGTVGEALVTTAQDLAVGTGIVRAPAMHQADGDAPGRPIVLPQRLLMEYSTDVPGATPTITIVVRGTFIGIHPSLVEG